MPVLCSVGVFSRFMSFCAAEACVLRGIDVWDSFLAGLREIDCKVELPELDLLEEREDFVGRREEDSPLREGVGPVALEVAVAEVARAEVPFWVRRPKGMVTRIGRTRATSYSRRSRRYS